MTATIEFHSVKGGAGCTTVATLFALQLHRGNNPVHLSTASDREQLGDVAAILGIPLADDNGETTVAPGFTIGPAAIHSTDTIDVIDVGGRYPWSVYKTRPRLLVIRNDYLSMRRACAMGGLTVLNGAVLVEEPSWPLTNGDVSVVLGIPVVETFTMDALIQRHVDAGILAVQRHPHFFHSLDRLVGVR